MVAVRNRAFARTHNCLESKNVLEELSSWLSARLSFIPSIQLYTCSFSPSFRKLTNYSYVARRHQIQREKERNNAKKMGMRRSELESCSEERVREMEARNMESLWFVFMQFASKGRVSATRTIVLKAKPSDH